MAVSTDRPLRHGIRLASGSLTIISLRFGLVLAASIPALLVAWVGMASSVAKQPYYSDIQGRLPVVHLMRFLKDYPDGVVAAGLVALVIVLLGQQVLVAGALHWFSPERVADTKPRPARDVFRHGTPWLWTMLRIVGLALIAHIVGAIAIGRVFRAISNHGAVAGWTAYSLTVTLSIVRLSCHLLWAAIVGAWAFWCRVCCVSDGRHVVRSAALLAWRAIFRRPAGTIALYIGVTLAGSLGGAIFMFSWRQDPPASVAGAWAMLGLWSLLLGVQAYLWHWLLRSARLLYAHAALADLRERPDGPWGIVAWFRRKLKRKAE